MIEVLKRNGKIVEFDSNKIINAISKAYNDIYNTNEIPDYAEKIADDIIEVAKENDNILAVEEIQELVEDFLTEYKQQKKSKGTIDSYYQDLRIVLIKILEEIFLF